MNVIYLIYHFVI